MFDLDDVMAKYAKMQMIEDILNAVINDQMLPEKTQKLKDLHFLTDHKSTPDPKKWVENALLEYEFIFVNLGGADDERITNPVARCVFVKKFRKVRNKLRKTCKDRTPTTGDIIIAMAESF